MPKNKFAGRYIYHDELEKIITEAVQAENEACAKLLEDKSARAWDVFKRSDDHTKRGNKYYAGISDGMDEISEAIRARRQ